jgi:TonB family protein
MENKMRPQRSPLAVVGFLAILSFHALAADVKVVANPSVKADSISAEELTSIFLGETNTLKDGSHVEPVFEREGAVHETFIKDFLRQTDASLHSHYGELVFTGKASMPKSFNSDAEVVDYVAKTRGAIGYVSFSASTDGVKVLAVMGEERKSDRALLVRIEPNYPETLKQMQIGGIVRLQVFISAKGSVEDARLLGGNPILGEAAIAAVRKWVYAPASSQTSTEVTLRFNPQH